MIPCTDPVVGNSVMDLPHLLRQHDRFYCAHIGGAQFRQCRSMDRGMTELLAEPDSAQHWLDPGVYEFALLGWLSACHTCAVTEIIRHHCYHHTYPDRLGVMLVGLSPGEVYRVRHGELFHPITRCQDD